MRRITAEEKSMIRGQLHHVAPARRRGFVRWIIRVLWAA